METNAQFANSFLKRERQFRDSMFQAVKYNEAVGFGLDNQINELIKQAATRGGIAWDIYTKIIRMVEETIAAVPRISTYKAAGKHGIKYKQFNELDNHVQIIEEVVGAFVAVGYANFGDVLIKNYRDTKSGNMITSSINALELTVEQLAGTWKQQVNDALNDLRIASQALYEARAKFINDEKIKHYLADSNISMGNLKVCMAALDRATSDEAPNETADYIAASKNFQDLVDLSAFEDSATVESMNSIVRAVKRTQVKFNDPK